MAALAVQSALFQAVVASCMKVLFIIVELLCSIKRPSVIDRSLPYPINNGEQHRCASGLAHTHSLHIYY